MLQTNKIKGERENDQNKTRTIGKNGFSIMTYVGPSL